MVEGKSRGSFRLPLARLHRLAVSPAAVTAAEVLAITKSAQQDARTIALRACGHVFPYWRELMALLMVRLVGVAEAVRHGVSVRRGRVDSHGFLVASLPVSLDIPAQLVAVLAHCHEVAGFLAGDSVGIGDSGSDLRQSIEQSLVVHM